MPAAKLYELATSGDVKADTLKAVGDLSKMSLFSGRVLVAIYIQPNKTKGGIILTNNATKEDVYQGMVGLVVKKGPLAFKNDESTNFHGQDVQIGDWVAFRPGDGKRIQINGVDCRIIEDTIIDAVVESPEIVTYRS